MLPVLRIGPAALQTSPLVLVLGFWLALELAGRQGARRGIDGGTIQTAGVLGAVAGILVARLGYVVQYWPLYRDNLLGIVSLTPEALSLLPGLAAGLAAGGGYLALKQVPLRPWLDAMAPGLAVFAAASALASFLAGTAFGLESDVPWAIALWDAHRQPVQLYELAGSMLILGLLLRVGQNVPAPGLGFLLFVALYGGLRVLLEPLQAESVLLAGGLRSVQVVGLLAVMRALWKMRTWYRAPRAREPAE